jgi:cytochrome P450
MQQGENTKDDLLSIMLESNMRETDGNGGMTIKEVTEECKMFYFAGTETTSILLTWTVILLSMHPEWQDHAREEVLSLFGKKQPDYDSFSRLKIVSAN